MQDLSTEEFEKTMTKHIERDLAACSIEELIDLLDPSYPPSLSQLARKELAKRSRH